MGLIGTLQKVGFGRLRYIYELNTVAGMHAAWPYVILYLCTILPANLVVRRPALTYVVGFAKWGGGS